MASRLGRLAREIEGVELSGPPQVNSLFARLDRSAIEALQEWSYFYDWDRTNDEVRWMCSFDTTIDDVERFVSGIAEALASTN
jgi:threonine aldolase